MAGARTGAATLARVTAWTSTAVLARVARLIPRARPFNLLVTNVPGPRRILRTLSLDRNGMLVLELRTPQVAADQDPGMQSQAVLEASRIIYKRQ